MKRTPCAAAALLAVLGPAAVAQTGPTTLDPVVVSVERSRQSSFDAPAAIGVVGRDVIDSGGPQVNLSEVLNRVPGIAVLNRQNYAQDLQLSIRGFGSRSTFGIRGVRLIVDGIPATMPDGQGQASSIALGSASRIEVLRGPLAQLYGNAAGGVVQVFSETDARAPVATASLAAGPWDMLKGTLRFAAGSDTDSVSLEASQFRTDGWRDHAAAERGQLNARWSHDYGRSSRVSVVFNALEQPRSEDPLGLTRADWEANPRQAPFLARAQDASKSVAQHQLGGVLEHAFDDRTSLTARLYAGARELDNKLSVPPTAPPQTSPTGSGGIVAFERSYGGLGLMLAHVVPLDGGRRLRLVGGIDRDRMGEDRRGYVNDGGVRKELKRDETNVISNLDLYAQASFDLAPAWTATAGVRRSRVRFESDDRFVIPDPNLPGGYLNPDDSGSLRFGATNPVLGLAWRAAPDLNLYANVGRGFETPTFTELAYRPDGASGFNRALDASTSRHAELGAKWRFGSGQRIDAALFDIRTDDEILVASNQGGRTTFRNAGRTTRRGFEFQYVGRYGRDWQATLSFTSLRARFAQDVPDPADPAVVVVPRGNRLPGTPERTAFAELVWTPSAWMPGLHAAAEVVHTGKLWVNDANEDAAPASTVLNLRLGLRQQLGGWTLAELLRVDNATDRSYAGSVIVNEGNKRFFEPALPRNWTLILSASHRF